MAFGGEVSLGATGSTANNQTTLDLATAAAIAAGEFVCVVVAADNIASGGDDNACSGVTLGIGGQALLKATQIANAVAAQGGASCSIWYGVATSALASGGTIRATFGSGTLVDASGLTARKWTIAAGNLVQIEGTPGQLVNNTGADPGSLNVTTANIECLRVRGIASQVGNNTNLTPTASWTAWANGNSATTGTTGEICARAESRIFTGTGAASDPTYVSAIYASAYVAFKEVLPEITGTMDADDLADDFTSDSGLVGLLGALAVTGLPDTAALTGLVGLLGSLAVTESGLDTCSFVAAVSDTIPGILAANEDWSPRRPILLLHNDGPDGSSTFTDSSGNAHTVTPQGAVQIDTSKSKFGGASAMFLEPEDWLQLDGLADFAIGTGDFGVDTFALIGGYDNFNLIDWGGTGPKLTITSDGHLAYSIGGVQRITGTTLLSVDVQYHVGMRRALGVTRLFLDGVQEGSDYVGNEAITVSAGYPRIGTRT
jgi:hypothetical protein